MSAIADACLVAQVPGSQVETRFDPDYGIYWAFMNPSPRPCFNEPLLAQMHEFIQSIVDRGDSWESEGVRRPIRYGVVASKLRGVFNLGGDLQLFRSAIETRSYDRLVAYGEQCVGDLYTWYHNCHQSVTTMALVQGDALGGGFEAALSSTVLVAEESAHMGFPEVNFNLFPGMGAYSFLIRKVGRHVTDELITSGRVYTAKQLHAMGVVDVLATDGAGEAALLNYVRKHARFGNGRRAIESVRNEIAPVSRGELSEIVRIWAEAALRLEDRDLRMMDRLIRAQDHVMLANSEGGGRVPPGDRSNASG